MIIIRSHPSVHDPLLQTNAVPQLARPLGAPSRRSRAHFGSRRADALRGTSLYVGRDRLPGLGDDEFYHADLIGLTVLDAGGTPVGRVTAVHNHGAGDLLEVDRSGPKSALLLPFTRAIVPTVDLAAGRIIADIPEGLLE